MWIAAFDATFFDATKARSCVRLLNREIPAPYSITILGPFLTAAPSSPAFSRPAISR